MTSFFVKNIRKGISWLRYPLILIIFLFGSGLLLFHIIPTLDNNPDDIRFFSLQHPVLYIMDNAEDLEKSRIHIFTDKHEKTINKLYPQVINLDNNDYLKLSFSHTDKTGNPIILEWLDGTQFFIFPQSNLIITGNSQTLQTSFVHIQQGSVSVALSLYAKEHHLFSLDPHISSISGNMQLYHNFVDKKHRFFVNEAGGIFFENRTLNKLLESYLTLLFNLSADRFGQKLLNFQSYQQYLYGSGNSFSYFKNDFQKGFSQGAIENSIQKKGNTAWEQTKIRQWLDRF